jgi:sugar lactone lactonase YvrE
MFLHFFADLASMSYTMSLVLRKMKKFSQAAFAFCVLAGAAGCGGSAAEGTVPASAVPIGHNGNALLTARLHVDLASQKISLVPDRNAGSKLQGKAFRGNALDFVVGNLVDVPGDTGMKEISVAITNNSGFTVGQLPSGTVTGLKVILSPLRNVAEFSDLRPKTAVSTVVGSTPGFSDGPPLFAKLLHAEGVAVGLDHAVYVSDTGNHSIRKLANSQVTTIAGNGTAGNADGAGAGARFKSPFGIATNPVDGALIVADAGNNKVRRVTLDGVVTTIAGTGASGGANGSGSTATFTHPAGVAVSSNGIIYVSEDQGQRIRRILLSGTNARAASSYTVATLAGAGVAGFVDGAGISAKFNFPRGLAVDNLGGVFVADFNNNRIRRVSPTGEVATVAGTGASGSLNASGNLAKFSNPTGVAVVGNQVYITEFSAHNVRMMVLTDGGSPNSAFAWRVGSLAGASVSGLKNGFGDIATFNNPFLVATDQSRTLYVADFGNSLVRRVVPPTTVFQLGNPDFATADEPVQLANPDGIIPSAGDGAQLPFIKYDTSIDPGQTSSPRTWQFTTPQGVTGFEFDVTVEADARALLPPFASFNVGSPNVDVRTFGGQSGSPGSADGLLSQALFGGELFVAVDGAGVVYISDSNSGRIRRVGADGIVHAIAGLTAPGASAVDGVGTVATFLRPQSLAVTADGTEIYVADASSNRVRLVRLTGSDATSPASWTVSTVAGGTQGFADGPGNTAQFSVPRGIVLSPGKVLYVSEGNRIRRIDLTGADPSKASSWTVKVLAGDTSAGAGASGSNDGTGTAATFSAPKGIACDRVGNVLVCDTGNNRIRKITSAGLVTTIAGSTTGYSDGSGATSLFTVPVGICTDSAGYAYVVEESGRRVRRISPTGVVGTVAGTGAAGSLDGLGNVATFGRPVGIAITPSGAIYVGDTDVVRLVQRLVAVSAP